MPSARNIQSSNDAHEQWAPKLGITNTSDCEPLQHALDLALKADDGKKSRPRSVEVAAILHGLGVDKVTLTATLLSDPRLREILPLEQIQTAFGKEVSELVGSVHWLNTFKEYAHEKVSTPEQSERLRRMLLAMVKDIRALLIKLAYRVQRLRILRHDSYEIRRCVARETLDIYAPLANRLSIARLKWELEDLAFRCLEPIAYKQLTQALEESRIAREAYLDAAAVELRTVLQQQGIDALVKSRPKHIYSIWRKMQHKQRRFDELYDVRAVRILVATVSECYAALGIVHTLWRHIPKEFDDYIAHPKDNGYRSIHTAVFGPQAKVIEVQIRTREMHDFAERGVAAHWLYKEGGKQDIATQHSIASLQKMLDGKESGSALLDNFRTELFSDRVFVLTPEGDIHDLPRGASPLDFAYSVHTAVGHRCRGAKVNGRIVPLTYQLKSGERVEVLTAKHAHPSRDWLSFHLGYLHTRRARARVRQWFKQRDKERNIQNGRAIVERELRNLGVTDTELAGVATKFNLKSLPDLFAKVGWGELSVMQIGGALKLPDFYKPPKRPIELWRSRSVPEPGEFTIQGIGNLLTQTARCCQPMSGDNIVGYITRGKGVTVHRDDCPNIQRLMGENKARLVQVSWGGGGRVYPVNVRIEAYDRQDLLDDITGILSNWKIKLLRADTETDQKNQGVRMDLMIEISNTAQLSQLLDKLRQVPNVVTAQRQAEMNR